MINITSITDNLADSIKVHMDNQPFGITCSECGRDLEVDVTVDSDFDLILIVEPCEYCLDKEREKGFDYGKEEGYSDGFDAGYSDGFDAGMDEE